MSITLYGITNCDTVRKARAWLAEQHVEYAFHDYRKAGVPAHELDRWIGELGWERLVNRSGTTWRKLDDSLKASVGDAASARRLMLEHASVIKRPVVDWGDGRLTVGFNAAEWSAR